MKKILTILLALAISTSAFGINVKVINNTNASSGWRAKIASAGHWVTRYRYMLRKGIEVKFTNIPSDCTVQIISMKNIGKGTAMSSSKITLRKDIDSNQNVTIHIEECNDVENDPCKTIMATKENNDETASEGCTGKNKKYYYVETEYE